MKPGSEPAYTIEFERELDVESLPEARMREAITWVLSQHDVPMDAGLTVVITNDKHVRALNAQYRGIDAPTDILTFPADPLPDEIAEESDEPAYLGDMIIAHPYTVRHAAEAGHAVDDELVLLAIHGALHLLGYDHHTPADQDEMWAIQAEALSAAKVWISVPRFTFDDADKDA